MKIVVSAIPSSADYPRNVEGWEPTSGVSIVNRSLAPLTTGQIIKFVSQ